MSLDFYREKEKADRALAKVEKREAKKAARAQNRKQNRQDMHWLPKMPTAMGTLRGIITMVLLIASAIGIGVFSLYLSTHTFGQEMFESWFDTPAIAVLNIAPIVLVQLLLYFLTMRAWIANLITGAAVSVLTLINYFKLAFRDDPFLFEDIMLFKEAGDMAGKYEIALTTEMWLMFGVVIVSTLVLAFVGNARFRALACRAAAIGLSAAAVLIFIFNFAMNSSVYDSVSNNDLINQWNSTEVYVSKGFIYPFLNSMNSAFPEKPEGYSPAKAQEILAQYEDGDIPADEKINVVGIMLEAYNDFSKFDSIDWRSDPYDIWHKIEKESISGEIVTNIFAGGTIDSERTFMTGYADFGSLRVPTASYVQYFRDQGYFTEGSHPCYEWFYNRTNINANLGFDEYWFVENRYTQWTDGDVAYDNIFFPDILDLYEDATEEGDKPYFQFNVSYQNHGPYPEVPSSGGKKYVSSKYSDVEENIANNYFHGVRNTSQHVWNYLNELRRDEEPVVVVMFGDHNPWFGDGNSVYDELGINIDTNSQEGFLNYYSTPYYIWANEAAREIISEKAELRAEAAGGSVANDPDEYGKSAKTGAESSGSGQSAKTGNESGEDPDAAYGPWDVSLDGVDFEKVRGEGPVIGPYYLMNILFEILDWEGTAYMQYTDYVMENLPVIHTNGAYLTAYDGIMKTQEQLSEEQAAFLNDYRIVEYYMKYDYKVS